MKEPTAKQVSDVMASLGKKGGPARAAKLTPAERRKIAQSGAAARWGKKKPKGEKKAQSKVSSK